MSPDDNLTSKSVDDDAATLSREWETCHEDVDDAATRAGAWLASPPPGEEVVVSGLAGVFPDADNVYQLRDNLMNKVDMITEDNRRWNVEDFPDAPARSGKINCLTKFDCAFFGIHPNQADVMDPMCRILLEKTYEAIVDAGMNPAELRGTKTGVFIGCCLAESELKFLLNPTELQYGILTSGRMAFAQRIAFWLQINGPAYMVDTACSSGSYVIDHAYQAIRDGHCEHAIVAGCTLDTASETTVQFWNLGVLNSDGKCLTFDDEAKGYVRSEAIVVTFLQKARNARRNYATIVHSKTNCDGYKEKGITYPSKEMQEKLMVDFYRECQEDPLNVAWIEAHGTGTTVGDPEECAAIDAVFCRNRKTPLAVGSVKSNLGHSEPAASFNSLSKVIIAMETGVIPPNLHYKTPKRSIPSLISGRLQVITEALPWDGGLVGFNSFGFGGANCHTLVKSNEKEKVNGGLPSDGIPRLVAVSGRTELAVRQILDDLSERPLDAEYVRLYHEIHATPIEGHDFRGFTILQEGQPAVRDIQYVDRVSRSTWVMLSGLSSEWNKIGSALAVLPAFGRTLAACHRALQPHGQDLNRILEMNYPQNLAQRFISATATQIGLVEVLRSVGVTADGFVGTSVGEVAAAFADGCLTLEQAIVTSYFLGKELQDVNSGRGAMERIGLICETAEASLNPEVDVASRENTGSSVFSGPTNDVTIGVDFMGNIAIKSTQTTKSGLHSKCVQATRSSLIQRLKQVISSPKARSSSLTRSSSLSPKMASPEYFFDALFGPVMLEDTLRMLPKDSLLVNISPEPRLTEVLRRFPNLTSQVSLVHKEDDAVRQLLQALGDMYLCGVTPHLAALYPDVEFPVSRGTPMISPLIGWDHSRDMDVFLNHIVASIRSSCTFAEIDMIKAANLFYTGHVIDGRNLFPATGYVWLVAEAFAYINDTKIHRMVFEDIKFLRATNIPKDGVVQFNISIQKVTGQFEVVESGATVVSGHVHIPADVNQEVDLEARVSEQDVDGVLLNTRDIYKELRLRGYNYSGLFKSIVSSTIRGERAKIRWSNNWPAFMDNMLQLQILATDSRGLFVPTSIDRLSINKDLHDDLVESKKVDGEDTVLEVIVNHDSKVIRSGGVEIRGLRASAISRRKPLGEPVLERYQLVPYCPNRKEHALHLDDALRVLIHVALENNFSLKVKAVEVVDEETRPKPLLAAQLPNILGDLPLMQPDVIVLSPPGHPLTTDLGPEISVKSSELSEEENCMLVLGTNLLGRPRILQTALSCIGHKGFLISRETVDAVVNDDDELQILNEYRIGDERLLLLRKVVVTTSPSVMHITESNFEWITDLQSVLKSQEASTRMVLVSQGEPTNGIVGLFNCLRKEPGGDNLRCFFILDAAAPAFDLEHPLYKTQVAKDLAVNVYKDGSWGSYRHLRLPDKPLITTQHSYSNNLIRGDLASLSWIEGTIDPNIVCSEPDHEYVHVYYSAINFRDVMIATGKLAGEVITMDRQKQECQLGFEYSGRTSTGKRVMGMTDSKALTNLLCLDMNSFCWEIPDEWSLEDAATVPVVYSTAYDALFRVGRMARGDSVLIHAGSGGVGQAAINIALHEGCRVFTTVGTQEKRDFIKQRFPQLTDRHIGNSRDTSFEQLVMEETNGRGVDLVLNSLAEEKLQASVRCLAVGGRFLEIGKFDLALNNTLGMEIFLKESSFHGVMLDNFFQATNEVKQPIIQMIKEGIQTGAIRPLTRTVFSSSEVEKAFRFMGAGKHIGKVLINIRQEEEYKIAVPNELRMNALPRFSCKPKCSYIIAGGLGGFGLELADWLVLRGARKIVLTSRTGISNGYQSYRISIWRSYGVTVAISTADISTKTGVTLLLQDANKMGPVAAIFNLAVVLADAVFENQTPESFAKSLAPKATATRHLDVLSRRLCPQLQHFVVFSSVSCGRGNAGQTNYGMANSVMERICEKRVEEGYPGLAVQWGAVGEVGLVAEMQEDNLELVIGGTLQQRISSCLKVLDGFLNQPHPVVASMVVAEKKIGGGGENMLECVAGILGIRDLKIFIKTVSFQTTLAEMGMDSMNAVEIKQTLEREYQVFLTPQEIRSLTFAKVMELSEGGAVVATKCTEAPVDVDMGLLDLTLKNIGDEASADEPCMILTSLNSAATSTLFMLPGVEGMAVTFRPLAAMLKCRVVVLQLGTEDGDDLPEVLAQKLLQHMTNQLAADEPFLLLGYSFGSLVALHLTRLLEASGRQGRLLMVDGAPDFLVKMGSGDSEPKEAEVSLLARFIALLKPGDKEVADKTRVALSALGTWQERLDLFFSLVPSTGHREEFLKKVLTRGLHRQQSLNKFTWPESEGKIKSQVTLLRPNYPGLTIDKDYGLIKYCEKSVDVETFEASHNSIIESSQTADFINTLLSN